MFSIPSLLVCWVELPYAPSSFGFRCSHFINNLHTGPTSADYRSGRFTWKNTSDSKSGATWAPPQLRVSLRSVLPHWCCASLDVPPKPLPDWLDVTRVLANHQHRSLGARVPRTEQRVRHDRMEGEEETQCWGGKAAGAPPSSQTLQSSTPDCTPTFFSYF